MLVLIDGHNLIPKVGLRLSQLDDEQALVERLQVYHQVHQTPLEVFFDRAPAGRAGTRKMGTVTAHFIATGRTADDAILQRLRGLGKTARQARVISSDRRVLNEARALGAAVTRSEEFAREMAAAQEAAWASPEAGAGSGMRPEEVDDWLRLFGRQED